MSRWSWITGLFVAGLLTAGAETAQAGHTVAVRTSGQRSNGARTDSTVPYLTSGRSAFISGSVAPRIYASPIVDDPKNPQAKPVYNLIFYGSKQSFGDRSEGATPRTK